MLDLRVDYLRLDLQDARGHEHRVEPIAAQALGLMAERLDQRSVEHGQVAGAPHHVDVLSAPGIRLDLGRLSDGEVADLIANALVNTLALELGL